MSDITWQAMRSSERHDWRTPSELFEAIEAHLLPELGGSCNFTLDAAASDENHLCQDYFTERDNALSKDWTTTGWVWLNSPYGRNIGKWVAKAIEENKKGVRIVMLAFASTDTRWFEKAWEAATGVIFLRGRVNFLDHDGKQRAPAPKGSVLFVFDNKKWTGQKSVIWNWRSNDE